MSHDILNIPSPEWMHNPARNCAIPDEYDAKEQGAIADEWFPTDALEERDARRLCRDCPVARQCFLYAFERPELVGVWGGTTTTERQRLRKKVA